MTSQAPMIAPSRAPVVVVGGSIAGLAFGAMAAKRGLPVTILDADPSVNPALGFDESTARRVRRPTPQMGHSHAFLARAVSVLQAELPEALDRLGELEADFVRLPDRLPATLADRSPRPGDDDLVLVRARRSTFEAALRMAAASVPGVEIRAGVEAKGLLIDRSGSVPRVVGVHTNQGAIPAGVVVDASGRRSRVPTWLAEAGVVIDETSNECGIAYYSRFYRLYLGEAGGGLNRGYTAGSSFDRYSCLVFPADAGTFSVTFGILPEDKPLRTLRHAASFRAAAESIPVIADWTNRAAPVSDVHTMTGMRNRLRHLTANGRPHIGGLLLLADAAGISNPAHSRGCSIALTHAQAMAELLATNPKLLASDGRADTGADGAAELAAAGDGLVDSLLAPWVQDSRAQDEARLSRWRPDGPHQAPAVPDGQVTNGQAWTAAHYDRDVWQAFTRLQQLLATVPEVLADPEVVARVRAVLDAGLGLPPLEGPSRSELIELAAAHAPQRPPRLPALASS